MDKRAFLLSPGGTAETINVSAVPSGLWSSPTLFPALKVPGYFHGVPLGRENGLSVCVLCFRFHGLYARAFVAIFFMRRMPTRTVLARPFLALLLVKFRTQSVLTTSSNWQDQS
jgi:hypothetical protein